VEKAAETMFVRKRERIKLMKLTADGQRGSLLFLVFGIQTLFFSRNASHRLSFDFSEIETFDWKTTLDYNLTSISDMDHPFSDVTQSLHLFENMKISVSHILFSIYNAPQNNRV